MKSRGVLLACAWLLSVTMQATNVIVRDTCVNLENDQVRAYLSSVHYTRESDSRVKEFLNSSAGRLDIPNMVPVVLPHADSAIDSIDVTYAKDALYEQETVCLRVRNGLDTLFIYNLVPQTTYYYKVEAGSKLIQQGQIQTEGRLRMIYVPSIANVRDLGGWTTTDGKRIKYGLLYRGSELNGKHTATAEDIERLKRLGVQAEIDLRYEEEDSAGISAFNFLDATESSSPTYLYTNNSGCEQAHLRMTAFQLTWRREIQFIVDNLSKNRPVYFHCIWGADRTGMLSIFIQGLLGVPYDQLMKDYELTAFSASGLRMKTSRNDVMNYIESMPGSELKDKIYYYLNIRVGASKANLDYLRNTLLEEDTVLSGIRDMIMPDMPSRTFDLQGRKVASQPRKGIYVKIDADGKSQKILKQ